MLIFDGIEKDYITVAFSESRPVTASRELETITVPGRPGAYVSSVRSAMRELSVPIIIRFEDFEELQKIKEDMAQWLVHDEPRTLQFTDEIDRTYFAMLNGAIELEEDWKVAKGVLNFVCPDPHKYGIEEVAHFDDGMVTLNVPGTVPALPKIEVDILDDLTYVEILNGDKFFRWGELSPVDETPFQPTTLVASYPLNSTAGWFVATEVDNGHVAGTMAADQNGFRASAFGPAQTPTRFQGPVMRRALPEAIQDFRLEADVELQNLIGQTGMIELYCIDADGNTVTKIGIEDPWSTVAKVQAKFAVGNYSEEAVLERKSATIETAWNNFKGMMRVERIGDTFKPYFALVRPDGSHHSRWNTFSYVDVAGDHLAPIVEVKIAIRKYPLTDGNPMWVRNLKIYKYNPPSGGVPIIARSGDKLVINSADNSIRLNGQDAINQSDFWSTLPTLEPGTNTLAIEPFDKLSSRIAFRGRFK